MSKRYPSMPTTEIKLRHEADKAIDATVTLDNEVIVSVHVDDRDDEHYTPAEAERIGRALLRAAACCRAKIAFVAARKAAWKGRKRVFGFPENEHPDAP